MEDRQPPGGAISGSAGDGMTTCCASLSAVGVFADVDDAQLARLAGGFAIRRVPAAEVILREGDDGHELYVLAEGRLRVERTGPDGDQVHLADVVRGECFGEMAMLENMPRRATVTATEDCTVLVLPRDTFRRCSTHIRRRARRSRRTSRTGAAGPRHACIGPAPRRSSTAWPRSCPARRELLESLEPEIQWVALPRDTVLMREGDPADCMYFIVSGRLGAYVRREDEMRLLLNEMGPGESVGEMALLGMGPRTADVVVLDDCELLRLSRQAFDKLLNHDPSSGASLARIMAARLQRALKARSDDRAPAYGADDHRRGVRGGRRQPAPGPAQPQGDRGLLPPQRRHDDPARPPGHELDDVRMQRIEDRGVVHPRRAAAARPGPGAARQGIEQVTERVPAWRMVATRMQSAVADVSELTSAGNIKVFAELGPIFARMIAAYHDCQVYDRDDFERFLDSLGLRPGPSEAGGQDSLRQALVHYHDAMFQPEPKRKSELILLANFKVGLHEQIRLQPNIEGAMNAPLREGVFDVPLGTVLREPTMRAWRRFATKTMMRYRLPYGAVAVSGDLPLLPPREVWPDVLANLEHPELRLVAQRYGTSSGRRWLTTRDWADLDERMTFIFRLFRSRQKSLELFDPPFQYEQRLAIAGDQLPHGAL